MAYSVESDIEAKFKAVDFSSSTACTSAQVSGFISDADAYIDSKLARKFAVPITATESLKIIKQISVLLACHEVRRKLEVKTGETGKNQDGARSERKQALDMLEEILQGNILLINTSLAVSGGGFKSYNRDNSIVPECDVTSTQW